MDDAVDALAAFVVHHTGDPGDGSGERLRVLILVGAHPEGDEVGSDLRRGGLASAAHPDHRQEWHP